MGNGFGSWILIDTLGRYLGRKYGLGIIFKDDGGVWYMLENCIYRSGTTLSPKVQEREIGLEPYM
jgi:hypothetical protein